MDNGCDVFPRCANVLPPSRRQGRGLPSRQANRRDAPPESHPSLLPEKCQQHAVGCPHEAPPLFFNVSTSTSFTRRSSDDRATSFNPLNATDSPCAGTTFNSRINNPAIVSTSAT